MFNQSGGSTNSRHSPRQPEYLQRDFRTKWLGGKWIDNDKTISSCDKDKHYLLTSGQGKYSAQRRWCWEHGTEPPPTNGSPSHLLYRSYLISSIFSPRTGAAYVTWLIQGKPTGSKGDGFLVAFTFLYVSWSWQNFPSIFYFYLYIYIFFFKVCRWRVFPQPFVNPDKHHRHSFKYYLLPSHQPPSTVGNSTGGILLYTM